MKILLTNDDGILSPGIRILGQLLTERGLLSGTMAPDRERSGVGHAMTMNHPVRAWLLEQDSFPAKSPAYACDGNPTDCVTLALEAFFHDIDFVVSGINQGPNLGDDLTYSGTVCAALEGLMFDKSAMAISLCCSSADWVRHNNTASAVAVILLDWIEANPLPPGVMLNVNVPNVALGDLKGIRFTHKGIRRYRNKLTRMKNPHGQDCFWIGGTIDDHLVPGSDVLAVAEGYVSVTPIHMDMTHYETLDGHITGDTSAHLDEKLLSSFNTVQE